MVREWLRATRKEGEDEYYRFVRACNHCRTAERPSTPSHSFVILFHPLLYICIHMYMYIIYIYLSTRRVPSLHSDASSGYILLYYSPLSRRSFVFFFFFFFFFPRYFSRVCFHFASASLAFYSTNLHIIIVTVRSL